MTNCCYTTFKPSNPNIIVWDDIAPSQEQPKAKSGRYYNIVDARDVSKIKITGIPTAHLACLYAEQLTKDYDDGTLDAPLFSAIAVNC